MSKQLAKKNIKDEIAKMRAFSRKLSKDEEMACRFYCETGIYDKNWNLTDWYK